MLLAISPDEGLLYGPEGPGAGTVRESTWE